MIQYLYLGRVDYGEALQLQQELVALRQAGRIGNVLLLLEHPPVLTLGRNASRANILASDELLAARGVTLHEINRGGDVTYHGPGQLIGYPIFDLRSLRNAKGNRLGPVDFVRLMEEALIRLCGDFGVRAGRICGLTGVWCGLRWGSLLDESRETKATDRTSGEAKNRRHRNSRRSRRNLPRFCLQRDHGLARLRPHQSLRHHRPARYKSRKGSGCATCGGTNRSRPVCPISKSSPTNLRNNLARSLKSRSSSSTISTALARARRDQVRIIDGRISGA